MRTRLISLLAAPLVLTWSLCVGACSSPTGEKPQAAGDAGAGKTSGPRKGGFLVIPSSEPRTINPVLQSAFDLATPLMFEGLVGLDSKADPTHVLAESWDQPDDHTLVFHLRKGVTWHDGQAFSSADVLFTIDAIRHSNGASLWEAYLAPVDKVEASDANTVKVTFKDVYGPDLLSFTFGILPKHLYEGQDLAKAPANVNPVGTGPFKLSRWSPKQSIMLDANKNYWNGRPNVDQVELRFDVKAQDHLKELQAGHLDFAEIVVPSQWSGELRTPEFLERFETGSLDEHILTMIAWNCQKKPFDDKRVRVALTMALNRPRVIEEVLYGSARPLSGPFFASSWGADPNIAPWPFDVAKAAAALDDAGLKKPATGPRFSVELVVQDEYRGSPYDEMLAIFRNDLDAAGVELKILYLPRNEVVDRLILHNFDAVLFRFSADIADPDPYALLHSSQVNGGENYAAWVSADADKLLEQGRKTHDRAKRKEAYAGLHKIVHDEEPYTFLFEPQSVYAWSRRVHDVSAVDLSALPRWPGVARWWVDH
jgi:peptide/nickel transport system substrate-binding protein